MSKLAKGGKCKQSFHLRWWVRIVLGFVVSAGLAVATLLGFVNDVSEFRDRFFPQGRYIAAEPSPQAVFDEVANVFPMFVGSTWVYNYGRRTQYGSGGNSTIEPVVGHYTERVVSIESERDGKTKIIGVIRTGENFLPSCAEESLISGDLNVWYVTDGHRLYQVCSSVEAGDMAKDIQDETQGGTPPSLKTPKYVVPLRVGDLWPWDLDAPARNDKFYSWYVEAQDDVTVPAGQFRNSFRIALYTVPEETIVWVYPGVGVVAAEYHHHGTVEDYRLELRDFAIKPET